MSVTLPELLNAVQDAGRLDLFTSSLGVVEAYDSATKRASVRLATKRPIANEDGDLVSESLPLLIDVPIMFMGTAGVRITMPVEPGALVLVVFNMFDSSQFLVSGAESEPMTIDTHSISSSVAFPCGSLDGDASTQEAEPALILRAPEVRLGSKFLPTEVDNVALATSLVGYLDTMKTYIDGHTHAAHATPPAPLSGPVPTDIASPTVLAEKP